MPPGLSNRKAACPSHVAATSPMAREPNGGIQRERAENGGMERTASGTALEATAAILLVTAFCDALGLHSASFLLLVLGVPVVRVRGSRRARPGHRPRPRASAGRPRGVAARDRPLRSRGQKPGGRGNRPPAGSDRRPSGRLPRPPGSGSRRARRAPRPPLAPAGRRRGRAAPCPPAGARRSPRPPHP